MIGIAPREARIVPGERIVDAARDAQIVARVARGDRAALAELYDAYAPLAYSLAVRLVGEARAEDVVHDAFVALVERQSTFDPDRGAFRAWFLTAIHHRCLNLLRRPPAEGIGERAEALPDTEPEPVDQVVQHLRDRAVREALGQLPFAQREALVLAYYGGMSQSALAERLGVPLGTMKARMRRGLVALRGMLRGETIVIDEDDGP
jgi:RNA polymerase sigma-70 factor (ECF subfamily)